jgi:hypothetical protein
MTAAAARREPTSRALLALNSESITTPAKMMMSAKADQTLTTPASVYKPGTKPRSSGVFA